VSGTRGASKLMLCTEKTNEATYRYATKTDTPQTSVFAVSIESLKERIGIIRQAQFTHKATSYI
jgi:hypothetical protein